MTRMYSSAAGFVFGAVFGLACQAQTGPLDLELEVSIVEYGPDGKSWDGVRIYLLPFETTTVSPPELAVCVYTDSGESVCSPKSSALESPCPDSFKCAFTIHLVQNFDRLSISIFDIDPVGGETGQKVGQLIGDGIRSIEEIAGRDLAADTIERGILAINERRWTWVETLSFDRTASGEVPPERDERSEAFARSHAAAIVPPQMTSFELGRIATPFDLRALGDCLYPMPQCVYGYVSLSVRSDTLEEELAQ